MKYHMRHEYSSLLPGCLDDLAQQHSTFIETGTNIGKGIDAALAAGFKHIVSIEEDPSLFAETLDRFRDVPMVLQWCGSSADMLRDIMLRQLSPCVVYLDAHSIEANPLLEELEAIANSPCKSHVLLIDDVRMFDTPDWHGLKKQDAIDIIMQINPAYNISYRDTAHGSGDLLVARV